MNTIYQHFSIISCRFSNEATIPVSYRFLMSQFAFLTEKAKNINIKNNEIL